MVLGARQVFNFFRQKFLFLGNKRSNFVEVSDFA